MIYDERFFEDMNHAIDCYEYADDAKRLRSFLQDKIDDYARRKASEEINKLFWSKRK